MLRKLLEMCLMASTDVTRDKVDRALPLLLEAILLSDIDENEYVCCDIHRKNCVCRTYSKLIINANIEIIEAPKKHTRRRSVSLTPIPYPPMKVTITMTIVVTLVSWSLYCRVWVSFSMESPGPFRGLHMMIADSLNPDHKIIYCSKNCIFKGSDDYLAVRGDCSVQYAVFLQKKWTQRPCHNFLRV